MILLHTYYKLANEDEYSAPRDTGIYKPNGELIAMVPAGFSYDLSLEGSGKLSDGRIVNFSGTCSYGTPGYHGATSCYQILNGQQFPWGKGHGVPVEPLRSIAVDPNFIPFGSVVYIQEFDGLQIPSIGGVGGFTHDGLFRAEDSGGGVRGNHIDIYAGPTAMYRWLDSHIPTSFPDGSGLHARLMPSSYAPPRFGVGSSGISTIDRIVLLGIAGGGVWYLYRTIHKKK